MHELGIMKQVVKGVIDAAVSANASDVKAFTLLIGELRNFHPEWVQRYYDMLAEGSVAAGASVRIETVPATAKCNECGELFRIDIHAHHDVCCPDCGSNQYILCTGNEMILKNIEIGDVENG